MELKEKINKYFSNMALYKKAANTLFLNLSLPNFIRDYFIRKYSNQDGTYDIDLISEKVKQLIPNKETWPLILDNIIINNNSSTFLAKIKVLINLKEAYVSFAMPDLDINFDQTIVSNNAWQKIKEENMTLDNDFWGIITINSVIYNNQRKINLTNFKAFKPYKVDLNYFVKARENFTLDEWMSLVLGAMDYNSNSFESELNKITMISRLIPFVSKRINIIELAPKGTGKSYVFSRLSKYSWLNSGGIMTRAKLFYDMRYHTIGLIGCYDVVSLDEIKTIKFNDIAEMQGALKGYLESGEFVVGNKKTTSSCSMVFLGNIKQENMDTTKNMVQDVSILFNDSALLDRIHGFIRGWDIPRMSEAMKVNDLSINSEYFSEILHLLRDDSCYEKLVDELLEDVDGDTRDITAVKRLAASYLKLLFPHYRKLEDVDIKLFKKYCLDNAIKMRQDIKNQLCILDEEYLKIKMPIFKIKGEENDECD